MRFRCLVIGIYMNAGETEALSWERRQRRRETCGLPGPLAAGRRYGFSYWLRMADVVDTTVPLGQSVTLSNGLRACGDPMI